MEAVEMWTWRRENIAGHRRCVTAEESRREMYDTGDNKEETG